MFSDASPGMATTLRSNGIRNDNNSSPIHEPSTTKTGKSIFEESNESVPSAGNDEAVAKSIPNIVLDENSTAPTSKEAASNVEELAEGAPNFDELSDELVCGGTNAIDDANYSKNPFLHSNETKPTQPTVIITPPTTPENESCGSTSASIESDRSLTEFIARMNGGTPSATPDNASTSSQVASDVSDRSLAEFIARINGKTPGGLKSITTSPVFYGPTEEVRDEEVPSAVCVDRNEAKIPSPMDSLVTPLTYPESPVSARSLETTDGLLAKHSTIVPSSLEPTSLSSEFDLSATDMTITPGPIRLSSYPNRGRAEKMSSWRNVTKVLNSIAAMTSGNRFNLLSWRSSPETLLPIICALLVFVLHATTIFNGEFVWDDRAAVLSNPDVLGQRGLLELFRRDFWGQDMASEVNLL